MNNKTEPNKHRGVKKAVFRKWHRRIGFTASIFLVTLATSGIILNHYSVFSLQSQFVQSAWLLDWYGVKQPENIRCIEDASDLNDVKKQLCQVENFIFVKNEHSEISLLATDQGTLVNLLIVDTKRLMVTDQHLILYTSDYQLIDTLDVAEELSTSISSSYHLDKKVVVQTTEHLYSLDVDNLEMTIQPPSSDIVISPTNIKLHHLTELKPELKLKQQFGLAYQQQQISYLKVVQDLHSGQLFSLPGKIVMDIAGFCILLLSMSGFITWTRRKNR